GNVGELRYDPFAMLPFCGYHFGDYFNHWLNISSDKSLLPQIFYVNWFKKDQQGKFLWPGFSQNMRILQWIYHRLDSSLEKSSAENGSPEVASKEVASKEVASKEVASKEVASKEVASKEVASK